MSSRATRITEAVNNEKWQKFRRALKGSATSYKLERLLLYYNQGLYHFKLNQACDCGIEVTEAEWENYKIRIDNYIKALCRGGQLYPGESLQTALDNNWNLKIKR